MSFTDVYEKFYPAWASPDDVQLAERDGLTKQFVDKLTRYRVCPYGEDSESQECGKN